MNELTLDVYLGRLQEWQNWLESELPEGFWLDVAHPWFREIAPAKAVEHGIECWVRMGPKGLVVNINACYYRWKRLVQELSRDWTDPAVQNAIRDGFGYTVMLGVMLECDGLLDKEKIFKYMSMPLDFTPEQHNEMVIRQGWEDNNLLLAWKHTLKSVVCQWKVCACA